MLLVKACKIAKEGGLKLTVHAGEAGGPENIIGAIEKLGADRIGHGVRVMQSEKAMALVKERNIPLELCLTSNFQTQAVKTIEEHPIRKLFDDGVNVTLNTDDPSISGITLGSDLQMAMNEFDFTIDEIKKITMNGVNAAFISEDDRKEAIKKYFNF